jgi:hypothetical protein
MCFESELFIHSVENVGNADLIFTAVAFLDSTNDQFPQRIESPGCTESASCLAQMRT